MTESFFLYNVVGYRELKLRSFSRVDCCPGIETCNALSVECLRPEIFEQCIQLCQRIADSGSGKKSGPQITSRSFLYISDCKIEIQGSLASVRIAKSCYAVMTCREHKVLKLMRLIHKDMVDTHAAKINRIVFSQFYVVHYGV